MCVALDHGERFVADYSGNVDRCRPALRKLRRGGVAEIVEAKVAHAGLRDRGPPGLRYVERLRNRSARKNQIGVDTPDLMVSPQQVERQTH